MYTLEKNTWRSFSVVYLKLRQNFSRVEINKVSDKTYILRENEEDVNFSILVIFVIGEAP